MLPFCKRGSLRSGPDARKRSPKVVRDVVRERAQVGKRLLVLRRHAVERVLQVDYLLSLGRHRNAHGVVSVRYAPRRIGDLPQRGGEAPPEERTETCADEPHEDERRTDERTHPHRVQLVLRHVVPDGQHASVAEQRLPHPHGDLAASVRRLPRYAVCRRFGRRVLDHLLKYRPVVRAAHLHRAVLVGDEKEYVFVSVGLRVLREELRHLRRVPPAPLVLLRQIARKPDEHLVVVVRRMAQRREHHERPDEREEEPERQERPERDAHPHRTRPAARRLSRGHSPPPLPSRSACAENSCRSSRGDGRLAPRRRWCADRSRSPTLARVWCCATRPCRGCA